MKHLLRRIYNSIIRDRIISNYRRLRIIVLRKTGKLKVTQELEYWKGRKAKERILTNDHYEYSYTIHFGIHKFFYEGKKILDIGCGPRGSLEWADMASQRVGLDSLANSYRKLGTTHHKMQYVNAYAEKIPFPDNYFDVVCSFNSLDHVDNLDLTINEIKRVLAPGGMFLLLTNLNHPPSPSEPMEFSWDVMEKFFPELKVIEERHYEKTSKSWRETFARNIRYDHSIKSLREGILSAKFIKIIK